MSNALPKALAVVVVVLLIIFLTKVVNNTQVAENPGTSFWLERQKVVACSPDEITLEDKRGMQTQLMKDQSWPLCSIFQADQVLDFQLSRGEKTHFLKLQPSSWWR